MATVTSNQGSAGIQPKGLRVGLVAVSAVYSPNGSMSSGDVIQMIKVPANSRVIDLKINYALSGNGSFIVGDGVDTDRYVAANTGSLSTGVVRMAAGGLTTAPYTYSTDDTIDITLSTSTNPSSGAVYMDAIIALDF